MKQQVYSYPTTYKGVRYRSRLEARWALVLRAMQMRAAYEVQSFRLPSGVYLPDFWLNARQMHAEVKPVEPNAEMLGRIAELTWATQYPCVLLIGMPRAQACDVITPRGERVAGGFAWGDAGALTKAVSDATLARFAA